MTEIATSSPRFTEEQIRRSLLTLAKHAGNSIHAAADLETQGLTLAASTLRDWRNNQHRDLYREIHETHRVEIEGQLVSEFRELAQAATQAARLAVDKTVQQLENGDIKDAAGAARNLTVTGATAMDKLYLATDRPTSISEHRGAAEILNALESRYGPNTVNSTAIEENQPGPLMTESVTPNAQELPAVTGRS